MTTAVKRKKKRKRVRAPIKELPSFDDMVNIKLGGHSTRKGAMTPVVLAKIETLCRTCASPSDTFIAEFIGVTSATIINWKKDYKGFKELLAMWKAEGISELRSRAYQMATDVDRADGQMIRYLLDRRDNDFKQSMEVGVTIKPDYNNSTPPAEFI